MNIVKKTLRKTVPFFIWLLLPVCVLAQNKVTTFKLWSWIPNYEKSYFNLAAKEFNKENPQTPVAITYTHYNFNDLLPQLEKDHGKDNVLPDIVAIEFRQWPNYEAAGPGKYLVNLNEVYDQDAAELFNNTRYEYVYHKQHYALGWQAAPLIFAYRKDVLDKLGITSPLKTWGDFKQAAVKAHDAGKILALMEVKDPQIFYGLFLQKGGDVYDSKGNFVFPKYESQAREVFQFLKYLHDKAGFGKRRVNDFMSGKFTTQFDKADISGLVAGDWVLMVIKKLFPEQRGQWRIQAAPVWSNNKYKGVAFGGTGYALVKKSSRTQKEQALLKKFITFATISFHMQALYFKMSNIQMTNKMLSSRVYAITFTDPYLGDQKTLLDLHGELEDMAPRYVYPGLNTFFNKLLNIQGDYIDGKISLNQLITELSKKPN